VLCVAAAWVCDPKPAALTLTRVICTIINLSPRRLVNRAALQAGKWPRGNGCTSTFKFTRMVK
jgi:hypothetical protein